jgi:rRNA-processing protein FCF1
MKILLDTNFLLYTAKQKIDYTDINADFYTITPVIEELKKLKETARKQEDRQSASIALQLLETNKVKILKSQGKADDEIVKKSKNHTIATMDKQLKKRLKGKSRILTIRGKKELEIQ